MKLPRKNKEGGNCAEIAQPTVTRVPLSAEMIAPIKEIKRLILAIRNL
jgi:hypothetical protein